MFDESLKVKILALSWSYTYYCV